MYSIKDQKQLTLKTFSIYSFVLKTKTEQQTKV